MMGFHSDFLFFVFFCFLLFGMQKRGRGHGRGRGRGRGQRKRGVSLEERGSSSEDGTSTENPPNPPEWSQT